MGVEKTMDNADDTTMLDELFGPESDDDTEAAKVAPHPSQATKLDQHRKEVKGSSPCPLKQTQEGSL